jgi:hypothetical protein
VRGAQHWFPVSHVALEEGIASPSPPASLMALAMSAQAASMVGCSGPATSWRTGAGPPSGGLF